MKQLYEAANRLILGEATADDLKALLDDIAKNDPQAKKEIITVISGYRSRLIERIINSRQATIQFNE